MRSCRDHVGCVDPAHDEALQAFRFTVGVDDFAVVLAHSVYPLFVVRCVHSLGSSVEDVLGLRFSLLAESRFKRLERFGQLSVFPRSCGALVARFCAVSSGLSALRVWSNRGLGGKIS